MITDDEIKAADAIIIYASMTDVGADTIASNSGKDVSIVKNAAAYLQQDGLIKIDKQGMGYQETYRTLGPGVDLNKRKVSYKVFLEEKAEKAKRQIDKDELDMKRTTLQIEELEVRLEVINKEQLKFWNRQRWQFWLTFMVAGAAFILSIINFIKSIIVQ